jgi:hypothetical protein
MRPRARRRDQQTTMAREYDIYIPVTQNDGTPVDAALLAGIKETLVRAFGGYTHSTHRNEGAWRIGGVTFHDEVTVLRVLDLEASGFDLPGFKRELEAKLRQKTVLMVSREVQIL